MSFRALNLSPQILQAVQDADYTEPTPIQVAAIPHILAGHDVIGIAQTGTGKTAAFVLPILTKLAGSMPNGQRRGTRVLVVAPTEKLAEIWTGVSALTEPAWSNPPVRNGVGDGNGERPRSGAAAAPVARARQRRPASEGDRDQPWCLRWTRLVH